MDKKNSVSAYKKEDLYQTLDRINLWIENSDTKTSIVIAAMGVILAVILSKDYVVKYKAILSGMLNDGTACSFIYVMVFILSICILGKGCYHLFRVLIPQTDTKLFSEKGICGSSLIFFSTIAKNKSYEEYKNNLDAASETDQRNDLMSQIFICSRICEQNFNNYKKGISYVLLGFSCFAVISIIGFIVG